MSHSTRDGGAPRLVVTSVAIHSFHFSDNANQSNKTVSIRCDANISKTEIENRLYKFKFI